MPPQGSHGVDSPLMKFESSWMLLGIRRQHFPSVLIAGTNGKGSTASTLASILSEAGLRTGLYTSPHLERPNERIRLGLEEIADDDFARLYFRVHDAGQQLLLDGRLAQLPSYFEILTALAFLHFAKHKVDVAVLEVGMGGRLDATNVVDPLALDRHRYFARSHGVAGPHHLCHRSRKSRNPPRRRNDDYLAAAP